MSDGKTWRKFKTTEPVSSKRVFQEGWIYNDDLKLIDPVDANYTKVGKYQLTDNTIEYAILDAPSSPVAWTPDQLGASLSLWLDADDESTITESGGFVSQWDDKSGNSRHFSQAAGSKQPEYLAVGFSGKPSIRNSTNDTLGIGGNSLGRNVGGITCAIVGVYPTGVLFSVNATDFFIETGGVTRFVMTPNSSASTPNRYALAGRRLDSDSFAGVSSSTDSLADLGNSWIRIGQRAYSDGVANHWTNGTQDMTNEVVGTQGAGNTSDTDSLKAEIFFGIAPSPQNTQMSEIVLTHSTMTNADRQKLEGYLAHKWGLTGSLPIGHPYKSVAPTI